MRSGAPPTASRSCGCVWPTPSWTSPVRRTPRRALGERVHERWTLEEYPELGRIATGLRSSARRLDAAAVAAERSTGRRLGGYAGAGFLGRGDEAHRHVADVAAFVGTAQGASIGGFPLLPGDEEGFLTHPSHTLGIATPDYEGD